MTHLQEKLFSSYRELRIESKGGKHLVVSQLKTRPVAVMLRTDPVFYFLRRCFLLVTQNQVPVQLTKKDFVKV